MKTPTSKLLIAWILGISMMIPGISPEVFAVVATAPENSPTQPTQPAVPVYGPQLPPKPAPAPAPVYGPQLPTSLGPVSPLSLASSLAQNYSAAVSNPAPKASAMPLPEGEGGSGAVGEGEEPPPVTIPQATPPGVKDATGSYAVVAPNNFSGLTGQVPGTYEAQVAAIRAQYLTGIDPRRVTTYNVYNNKNEIKRIEEYIYTDASKTRLATIITRFFDASREVHVENFKTTSFSKRLFLSSRLGHPAPLVGTFMVQWDIYQANAPHPNMLTLNSQRTFSPSTGINTRWISTEYDAFGRKTREFQKNPDASVQKITLFNPNGTVKSVEIRNPVVNPANFLGPVFQAIRLRQ